MSLPPLPVDIDVVNTRIIWYEDDKRKRALLPVLEIISNAQKDSVFTVAAYEALLDAIGYLKVDFDKMKESSNYPWKYSPKSAEGEKWTELLMRVAHTAGIRASELRCCVSDDYLEILASTLWRIEKEFLDERRKIQKSMEDEESPKNGEPTKGEEPISKTS